MKSREDVNVSIGRRFAWPMRPSLTKKFLDKTCTYTLNLLYTTCTYTLPILANGVSLCLLGRNPYLLIEDVIYGNDISLSSHLHCSDCRFLDLHERTGQ